MTEQTLERYQILDKIGAGGMGTVYRAWDREIEREVALKWLPSSFSADPMFTQRFKREARVIARLEHPHIIPIYDVGESEGRPFIIMRLLTGGTLRERVALPGYDLMALVRTIEQVSDALAAAHGRQIVHRDIKPGNILFDDHGSAFLSDFGIAKVLDSGTQLTGSGFIGTPAYMSPEQFIGQSIDGRSDQYSLGIVVYEALTGNLPFKGNTAQMMYKHINVEPPPIDFDQHPIPQEINAVLEKALAKSPDDRYARITDFSTALRMALRQNPDAAVAALPLITSAGPSTPPRPATGPTSVDSISEAQTEQLLEEYHRGLEAMSRTEWAAALAAFDLVVQEDPSFGNAQAFREEASTKLAQATAAGAAAAGAAGAVARATPFDATTLEPPPPLAATSMDLPPVAAATGTGAGGATAIPASRPVQPAPAAGKRSLPVWAIALGALLLLLLCAGGGYAAFSMLGGGDEPPAVVEEQPGGVAGVAGEVTGDGEVVAAAGAPGGEAAGGADGEATGTGEPGDGAGAVAEATATPEPTATSAPPTEELTAEPEATAVTNAAAQPTETPPPTDTPAPAEAAVRVNVASANLRRGPGTVYPTSGAVFENDVLRVLARTRDGTWYNVESANGLRAWLAASVTEAVEGAVLSEVEVAATIPAAPTSTPRPLPTSTPIPPPPPPPTEPPSSGGGGGSGGGSGGGGGGGGRYTPEPP